MKIIELTQGYFTLVDIEDYEYLNKFSWRIQKNKKHVYARTSIWLGNGKSRCIYMHRLILSAVKNDIVDHKNGNSLDNRRRNLRICSSYQNNYNALHPGKISYKGVYFKPSLNKYIAQIQAMGKKKHIGVFSTAKEAAIAYDKSAIELQGKFARLNFPLTE